MSEPKPAHEWTYSEGFLVSPSGFEYQCAHGAKAAYEINAAIAAERKGRLAQGRVMEQQLAAERERYEQVSKDCNANANTILQLRSQFVAALKWCLENTRDNARVQNHIATALAKIKEGK